MALVSVYKFWREVYEVIVSGRVFWLWTSTSLQSCLVYAGQDEIIELAYSINPSVKNATLKEFARPEKVWCEEINDCCRTGCVSSESSYRRRVRK